MEYDFWTIEFINYCPTKKVKEFVKDVVGQIAMESPSDSSIKITFTREGNYINGCCRICSMAGVFSSVVTADSTIRVLEEMKIKIEKQLDFWRQGRFFEGPVEEAS